jgi:glucose dehydrogenase
VAIDGDTGAYKWHFQLVHHDIWDFDNPPAPALLDITQTVSGFPVLAQIGKSGWMFILDRPQRQAGLRRGRTPGGQRRRARRVVRADAAVPAQAARARAYELHLRRTW